MRAAHFGAVSFFPGLLGAVVGGLFALFVGLRASWRTSRAQRDDYIRQLTAEVTSNAAMIQDVVAEYQTRQAGRDQTQKAARERTALTDKADAPLVKDDDDEPITLDGERLREYELNIMRGLAQLGWLVYKSPLYDFVTALQIKAGDMISSWSGGHAEWLRKREGFTASIAELDRVARWYTHLRPVERAAYLTSVDRPVDTPENALPTAWDGRMPDKTSRFGFWIKTLKDT